MFIVKHVKCFYRIKISTTLGNTKMQFKNNAFSMFKSKFFVIFRTIFLVLKNDTVQKTEKSL